MTNTTSKPMLYRMRSAEDAGFESPQEEYDAMREYTQGMIDTYTPHDILDTLVALTNVCEYRALLASLDPSIAEWWQRSAILMRATAEILNSPSAAPNAKLENPMLYFPDVKELS